MVLLALLWLCAGSGPIETRAGTLSDAIICQIPSNQNSPATGMGRQANMKHLYTGNQCIFIKCSFPALHSWAPAEIFAGGAFIEPTYQCKPTIYNTLLRIANMGNRNS